ncbi:MAG: ribonuclease P [Candidatus Bathyarchaeia archaeon]
MSEREKIKEIALERIKRLFNLALEMLHERPDLAQKYVKNARKIAMRARIKLPREKRLLICKHCKRFIFPGVSSRFRIQLRREPHVVVTCLYCGGHMRRPLRKRDK